MKLVSKFSTTFRQRQTPALIQNTVIRHQMTVASCTTIPTQQTSSVQSPSHGNGANTMAKHWSFLSLPAQTFQFDTKDKLNDSSLEQFMKSKYDVVDKQQHEGKLSLAHKSNTLLTLFQEHSMQRVDHVLQNKIMSKGDSLQQEHRNNIDQWLLFDYHDLDMNTGYDANGIIVCGLSTKCNQAFEIGPIILAKTKERCN